MDVLVDTNILCRDYSLRSPPIVALLAYVDRTDSQLILPSIVLEETLANYEREARKLIHSVGRASRVLSTSFSVEGLPTVEADVAAYRSRLLGGPSEMRTRILEITAEDANEAVRRLAHRLPPATRGSEFRDVLLWLAVKRQVQANAAVRTGFISNDHAFRSANGGLAQPLEDELNANPGGDLVFCSTVEDFLQQETNRLSWLTTEAIYDAMHAADFDKDIEHYLRVIGGEQIVEDLGAMPDSDVEMRVEDIGDVPHFFVSDDVERGGDHVYFSVVVDVELQFSVASYYPDGSWGKELLGVRLELHGHAEIADGERLVDLTLDDGYEVKGSWDVIEEMNRRD